MKLHQLYVHAMYMYMYMYYRLSVLHKVAE